MDEARGTKMTNDAPQGLFEQLHRLIPMQNWAENIIAFKKICSDFEQRLADAEYLEKHLRRAISAEKEAREIYAAKLADANVKNDQLRALAADLTVALETRIPHAGPYCALIMRAKEFLAEPGSESQPSGLQVQACRPEDRAMLNTEAGQQLIQKAAEMLRSDQPTELEMHRADYEAIKAAGFESPGELLAEWKLQHRQNEIREHDYPKLSEFFHKYAIGLKLAPSCLCCGQSTQDKEIGIRHLELADIVICRECQIKATSPQAEPVAVPEGWKIELYKTRKHFLGLRIASPSGASTLFEEEEGSSNYEVFKCFLDDLQKAAPKPEAKS
jgi:hypothetical protein